MENFCELIGQAADSLKGVFREGAGGGMTTNFRIIIF